MKITNNSATPITLTDIDRGIAGEYGQGDLPESWIAKQDCGIPAGGHIYVFDTERVMLSAELGQISKFKTATLIATQYSMTGTEVGPFAITGGNNTFVFSIGATVESVTLPTGAAVTMAQIVSAINLAVGPVSGFAAEESGMFRAMNMSPITDGLVEGPLGTGYGQRTDSILTGFLSLAADLPITIGAGSANATLGFHSGDFTKAQ